jgi:hypothetical protein
VIGHRYRVDERLGRGGMATVYSATDLTLDRSVALKVPEWNPDDEPRAAERFRREARAVAALHHPNVVTVFDVTEHEGVTVLVMQRVEGPTLAWRISDRGPLSLPEATDVAAQICDALAAAHATGIVHRDVKPSNVLYAADGVVKLGDFGISRAAEASLTMTAVHGSAGYMAPEHARGERPDPRSDLYALGCTLFETLTGRRPFTGDTIASVISQHLHAQPPAVRGLRPEIPDALDALVAELLAKDPGARPSSAEVVGARLRRIPGAAGADGTPPAATTRALVPTPTEPVAVTDRRAPSSASVGSRRMVALTLVAAAVAVAALLGMRAGIREPAPAADGTRADPTAAVEGNQPDDRDVAAGAVTGGNVAVGPSSDGGTDEAEAAGRSTRPTSRVTQVRRLVVRGRADGRISTRGVDKVDKRIADVVKHRREGRQDDARKRVDKLLDELEKLVEDGDVEPGFARQLAARLDALASG